MMFPCYSVIVIRFSILLTKHFFSKYENGFCLFFNVIFDENIFLSQFKLPAVKNAAFSLAVENYPVVLNNSNFNVTTRHKRAVILTRIKKNVSSSPP